MDHLASLRSNTTTLGAAARAAGIDTPISACPGWSVGRLLGHTAKILQRTTLCITSDSTEMPGDDQYTKLPRGEELFDVYDEIASTLCDTFTTYDPNAAAWNFTGTDLVASFWLRRMAHEIEIHRVDMQLAAGLAVTPIEPSQAADGIDELLFVLMPMRSAAKNPELTASFHLHCTDTDGEWLTTFVDGQPSTIREHAKGDMAARGDASSLYLWAWNRRENTGSVDLAGDASLAAQWATIVP